MPKLTEKYVAQRVRWWRKRLGLDSWDMEVKFGPASDNDGEEAACQAQPEYRRAVLHFCLARMDPTKVERYVCHELMHCFIWRLANAGHALALGDKAKEEWVRTEEETLTTQLELLLTRLI